MTGLPSVATAKEIVDVAEKLPLFRASLPECAMGELEAQAVRAAVRMAQALETAHKNGLGTTTTVRR